MRANQALAQIRACKLVDIALPNASQALVERQKLLGYLLSMTHPDGRTKAELFVRFGFTADNWKCYKRHYGGMERTTPWYRKSSRHMEYAMQWKAH